MGEVRLSTRPLLMEEILVCVALAVEIRNETQSMDTP